MDVAGAPAYAVVWWAGAAAEQEVMLPTPGGAAQVEVLQGLPQEDLPWPLGDPFTAFERSMVDAPGGVVATVLQRHAPVVLLAR